MRADQLNVSKIFAINLFCSIRVSLLLSFLTVNMFMFERKFFSNQLSKLFYLFINIISCSCIKHANKG